MPDVLILGGGVVGLSLAYELAGQNVRVRIVDRAQPGSEASWAAAGILPPCKFRMRAPPLEWLRGFSAQLHSEWHSRLLEETGIDNGYRKSGGIYLAESNDASGELLQTCERWRREGLTTKWLHAADLGKMEPALAGAYDRSKLAGAAFVAEETKIRSPRHNQALIAACAKRGVEMTSGIEAYDFETQGSKVTAVKTNVGNLQADRIVLATGTWSQPLAARLGLRMPVKPIRGQIVLLQAGKPILDKIINSSSKRYLLPRDDGRIMVGSTLEDVGFDRRNTAVAIADLLKFAVDLVPDLKNAEIERCWTGFRPASVDTLPYLGRTPKFDNMFIATGHYRAGLYLAPGTAVVMSRLIRGEAPGVDMTPFKPDRATTDEVQLVEPVTPA
jgi:glycine oxidase